MLRFGILRRLMKQYRWQLVLTYILFGLEMLGNLLRPFFFGIAVNDLIKGRYEGLILLSAVHFGYIIVSMIRQRFDTRTYTSIYTSLVAKFISRRRRQRDVSKLSALSTLARDFVDFLEHDVIYVIEAAYNILGSLVLLFFYDTSVVLVCLTILLPVGAVSYFYGKKMKHLNRQKNDELENQVDIIAGGNIHLIRKHYNSLRKWQIRISDQQAWNFGLLEIMVMAVIGISLLVTNKTTAGNMLEAGSIIGIYSYIQRFVTGLDTIPYTVERLANLNDITRRIELEQDDFPEGEEKEVA
jgi:ABC-type multidrug transport system fused ATPase/permease subunit